MGAVDCLGPAPRAAPTHPSSPDGEMTEAQAAESLPRDESSPDAAPPEPPKPEPWTGQKVSEWNAYYDLFVAALVLLLCFFASANKLTQSSVWTHLHAGRDIAASRSPITTDSHSYTEDGQRWVHVSWLADLIHYEIFNLASGLTPVDPNSQVNSTAPEVMQAKRDQVAKSEQWGAAGLIAADALIRALTVLVLLRIRHHGPGLWWSSFCAVLALGVVIGPGGVLFGGVSGAAAVHAATWGQLLLAVELLWLFRAFDQGRAWPLYGLVPLFLLWANIDESFLLGLLVFAVAATARLVIKPRAPKDEKTGAPSIERPALISLGLCAVVCLLNPSFYRIYPAAFSTLVPSLGWLIGPSTSDQLSYFGKSWTPGQREEIEILRVYILIVIGVGLASFAINHRRFNLPRFLVFVVSAVAMVIAIHQQTFFGVVLAAVLALNGQEWYQSTFGTEGRLGRGWAIFSTGGRAVMLIALSVAIFSKVTGWGSDQRDLQFGFDFDPDDFRFEAAETLRDAPIEGNVFNTLLAQGDAIIWRASPKRKTFIDSRRHLFSAETIRKHDELQKAIRDDDVAVWKPLMDELKISVVMLQSDFSKRTYATLISNKQWVPFYDDGAVVMFGQPYASAADLAYFRANRLDADNLVYKQPKPSPSSDKLPRATTDLDKIYQSRSVTRPQPHDAAAARWLRPADVDPNTPYLPDPAHCFMAIRELRLALSLKPDDTRAYRLLADAYETLLLEESGLIAGIPPLAENAATINGVPRQSSLLPDRFEQLLTTLNYAIITSPPPQTIEDFDDLAKLNFRLANLYLSQGYLDFASDRLDAVLKYAALVPNTPPEYLTTLTTKFNEMNTQLSEIRIRVSNMGVETQAGPLQKAGAARQVGALGLAIQNLEEALQAGMNPLLVKPALLDLYCQTGQPEKALELWQEGNVSEATLSDGPGTAAMRQGRVFFLLGNYYSVISLWSREAIPQLRFQIAMKAPQATKMLLEGDPMATTRSFLELPEQINRQAAWEFQLAMACLEAGQPADVTAGHFTTALTLSPDIAVRPVIAYYLQKLGKPVPPSVKDAKPIAAAAPAVK
jgi:tetratricopeptide (TPR) repeat protein